MSSRSVNGNAKAFDLPYRTHHLSNAHDFYFIPVVWILIIGAIYYLQPNPKSSAQFHWFASVIVTRTHQRCSAFLWRPQSTITRHLLSFLDSHEPSSRDTYSRLSIVMNPVPSCTTCMGHLCETIQRHGSFPWAVVWKCPICDVQFYCCYRSCGPKTRQITPFVLDGQLVLHHR